MDAESDIHSGAQHRRRQPLSRFRFAVFVGFVFVLGMVAVFVSTWTADRLSDDEAVVPIGGIHMQQLKPAPPELTDDGRWSPFAHKGPIETYVVSGHFTTKHSTRPLTLLMEPGAVWDGGPLGKTTLVMRLADNNPAARAFQGATVVYDAVCLAYEIDVASEAACRATADTRRTATTEADMQRHVKDITKVKHGYRLDTKGAPLKLYEAKSDLAMYAYRLDMYNNTRKDGVPIEAIVVPDTRRVTGGDLGHTVLYTPKYTDERGVMQPIADPLTVALRHGATQSLCAYLGPVARYDYQWYCPVK